MSGTLSGLPRVEQSRLAALAAAPVQMRAWEVAPEPMIPAGVATMQAPSQAFPLDPIASNADPLAALMARGRPQTQGEMARLYQQGTDAATNWAGTTPMRGIRAFHGSPHDFDRFDMSRIGTGEGGQAYGHGLYFAEREATARHYRDGLAPNTPLIGGQQIPPDASREFRSVAGLLRAGESPATIRRQAQAEYDAMSGILTRLQAGETSALAGNIGDVRAALDRARATLTALDSIGAAPVTTAPGRMYEVNLNVDPNRLLDWDAPLSQQAPEVRAALGRVPWGDAYVNSGTLTGGQIMPRTAEGAQQLRDAGIPGIRYLDGGSRAAGDGTRNYVMFDDSLIEILRKYGIAGLGLGLGAMSYGGQQSE